MWKKIAVGAVTVVAVGGVTTAAVATSNQGNGAALAGSGSPTATGSPSPSGSSGTNGTHAGRHGKHRKHGEFGGLRRLAHGQAVIKGKDGKYVTVDVIRGEVTTVSSTSIAVKAADGFTQTYTVGKDTKVRKAAPRTSGTKRTKPATISITAVQPHQQVLVEGTGKGPYVATRVLELAS